MLGLTFSSKLDWGSYIISIPKTTSRKIGALIGSMKFFSLEVALYLHKSTIHPCIEYCFHVWASAPNCCLELLDKLQERICRTVGPLLAVEPCVEWIEINNNNNNNNDDDDGNNNKTSNR